MSIGKNEILDDFNVEKGNFLSWKIVNLILIHFALILGIYFFTDYYILLFVETSKNQDSWLKIFSWVLRILICFNLTKQIFKNLSERVDFEDWQIAMMTFLTFLIGRIIFLSTLYLFLGAKVKYPDTPLYYFQGLKIAGLFGIFSYNRVLKFKNKNQLFSIIIFFAFLMIMVFIERKIM